ncbi:MAG: hypothetical protein V4659_06310 [Pseudomonadota bacterium]
MADDTTKDAALDRMSVAPDPAAEREAHDPRQEAGQDKSIERRLEKHPESKEARLDRGLDESMDASDPPASTQPVHAHEPPASSGFDADAERKLQDER